MQAVLLAAGKSTRTYPLTHHFPKGLLPVCNKPILEHTMEALLGNVEEIILVVGFQQEQIRSYFGTSFRGIPLRYVEQKEAKGTGDALLQAKPYLGEWFLMFYGDDLYAREDIQKCIQKESALLVKEVEDPRRFGVVETQGGYVTGLVEKPEYPKSHLANVGCYMLPKRIFDHTLQLSSRNEYEVTDYIPYLLRQGEQIRVHTIEHYWLPVGYPWDLLRAQEHCMGEVRIARSAIMHPTVKIEGHVHIGEKVQIGAGVRLKNTVIGAGATIGKEVVIEGSVVGEQVHIGAKSTIAFSILGNHVVVGEGVSMDAERGTLITCTIAGKEIDTGRYRLGAILEGGVELEAEVHLEAGAIREKRA